VSDFVVLRVSDFGYRGDCEKSLDLIQVLIAPVSIRDSGQWKSFICAKEKRICNCAEVV